MMHTILDLNEVFADGERRGIAVDQDEHLRNIIAFDPMKLLHFNGN